MTPSSVPNNVAYSNTPRRRGIMLWIVRTLHRLYKILLSPLFGSACRFHPSCSDYALQACEKYGCVRGAWYALRRIMRCHPGNPGGFDPVP